MVAFYQRSSTPEGTETLNCDFCCSAMRIYSRHTSLCRPKVTIMYFFWVGGVGLNKPKLKHHFHFSFYGDDSSAGSAVLFFFKECTQPSHAQSLYSKERRVHCAPHTTHSNTHLSSPRTLPWRNTQECWA